MVEEEKKKKKLPQKKKKTPSDLHTCPMACVPHCDPNYRDPFGLADGRTMLLSIGFPVNGTLNISEFVCLSSISQHLGSYALGLNCSECLTSWSILETISIPHEPWEIDYTQAIAPCLSGRTWKQIVKSEGMQHNMEDHGVWF